MNKASIVDFLYELQTSEINLWVEDGKLRYNAPKGKMTEGLKAQLRDRKLEIIAYLSQIQLSEGSGLDAIPSLPPQESFPLSFAQERLWFLYQLEGASATYNIPYLLEVEGAFDVAACEKAIATIVQRHEVLRTSFQTFEGIAQQVIHSDVSVAMEIVDLASLEAQQQQIRVEETIAQAITTPFDLRVPPLMRMFCVVLSATKRIFVFVIHHIITDAWSMDNVFKRELYGLYEAYVHQRAVSLSPLAIQYRDFAVWQRNWLKGEVLERKIAYWRAQLQGCPPSLDLPTDYPRPAQQSFRGSSQSFILPPEIAQSLEELGKKEGVTLFMLFLTALSILLYRYSGQEDVVIGTAIANRNRRELESLMGFFANTLALRVNLDNNLLFRELLQQVRQTALNAYAHQDIPFEKLVEVLQPERSLSHHPFFQVMLVMVNLPDASGEPTFSDYTITTLEQSATRSKFDLLVSVLEQKDSFQIIWEYNTDLFRASTIEQMAGNFHTLLEGIIADPDEKINGLPLLSKAEKQQLLVTWNETETDFPFYSGLHQLFEAQVENTPDAMAIVWENQSLTYRQLNEKANQIAHYFQQLGVKANDNVGICVERSLEMVIGILGILKVGAGYVPLDPAYPSERLEYMITNAQLSVLLTQPPLASKLPSTEASLLILDSDGTSVAQQPKNNLNCPVEGENTAYLIYTSGSTGLPKGVVMPHAPLVNLMQWQWQQIPVDIGSKTLQYAPMSFDVSCQEIFSTLGKGGVLVLIAEALRRDFEQLWEIIVTEGIERLFLPFVALQQLAEVAKRKPKATPHLKHIITAGEQLQITPAIAQFFKNHPHCRLHNHYGPSESHVVTAYTLPETVADWTVLPPIGKAIANCRLYILDEQLQPIPAGVAGELMIGGLTLAKGYYNRPDLTAEKFIDNPFGEGKLYKTGDLCRYLGDGNIEYLGRIDQMVKIRGFRVELGEIEVVLHQYHDIKEAIVIATEDHRGQLRLVAYVIATIQKEGLIAQLRQYLGKKLPNYMIPSAFVVLDQLPLTPSGKIDRRQLPTPETEDGAAIAPQTPTEELTAIIWQEVLQLSKIGREDNFFELGGHSLLATQVISRLREAFKIELPVKNLFEYPTLAQLATTIDQERQKTATFAIPSIITVERPEKIPLSFAQHRLWFIEQLIGSSSIYHLSSVLKIEGKFNEHAFEEAIKSLVERHESLRTFFVNDEGKVYQVIADQVTLELPLIEASHLSEEDLRQQITTEIQTPFDLSKAPLMRLKRWKTAENKQILALTFHHIISDGWSIGIFIRELGLLYQAYSQEKSCSLPDLPIQYADFAIWQRNWLQGEVLAQQLQYWCETLADLPPILELPTDYPRPPLQTFNGNTQSFRLFTPLKDNLAQICQKEGSTLFMALLATFAVLLSRYSGSKDIAIGSPIANRNYQEIEGLIGFFVNTLVLRTQLEGNPTFIEVLHQVRQVTLDAYAHQDIPLEKIVEQLQPERNLSHSPLFQVMFAWQNTPNETFTLPDIALIALEQESQTTKFDLTLVMRETQNEIEGTWEYNTDLFKAETIERMIGHFQTLLTGIIANPSQKISELPLLSDAEKQQVIIDWNQTQTDYPKDKCIHQLFEAQVNKTPDAVAVIFEGESLTYRELNQKSNQLAHYLQQLGVKPETLVGICVERSLEMVIGILAILKAGGAYVPLDCTYPAERLEYMLNDAQILVLLTQTRLISQFSQTSVQTVCLDNPEAQWHRESDQNSLNQTTTDQIAYIIYTSGSTGQPKGVIVPHRGVTRLVQQTNYINLTTQDKIAQVSNISFDAATFEIWGALLNGSQLVIIPQDTALLPSKFAQTLAQQEISVLFLTTALFNQIVYHVPEAFKPLNYLLFGGEAVDPRAVAILRETAPPRHLLHVYGPTENTTFSTWYRITSVSPSATTIPIGIPLANTTAYILDAQGQPVPMGVYGELHLGGDGLAQGYLNREELTAEKFIQNPFGEGKLYKTGDLCRYLADGNIEFGGRIDHQVKIRGFRIELGEIEAVLNQYSEIKETIVVVREDNPNDKRLIAYMTSDSDSDALLPPLREYLSNKLPNYMIPSAFVVLDKLPLTPNGKIDRKALPSPDFIAQSTQGFVAARTPVEETLTHIWAEILQIEQKSIGIYHNFFELGGHSLLATQMSSRLQNHFDITVSLRALFENPTIESLAKVIENSQLVKEIAFTDSDSLLDEEEGSL